MSTYELHALRYLGEGRPEVISAQHRELLIRMGLAKLNSNGDLEITEDGVRRLEAEKAR